MEPRQYRPRIRNPKHTFAPSEDQTDMEPRRYPPRIRNRKHIFDPSEDQTVMESRRYPPRIRNRKHIFDPSEDQTDMEPRRYPPRISHPKHIVDPSEDQAHTSAEKRKQIKKDYSREYRKRRKENPEVYNRHKELAIIRSRNYRARISEIGLQHIRELQRIRQRRYRNRMKERNVFSERKAPTARKITEQIRRINREKRRIQRASMHPLERQYINKKRRELYKTRKENRSRTCKPSTSEPGSSSGLSLSSGAMRTAKSRFRKKFLKMLPVECTIRAEVIAAGLEALTPRTKQAVYTRLGISIPSCRQEFDFDKSVATAVKDEIGESYEASETLCQGSTCKEFDFDKSVATAVKDEIGESYEALETLCQGHTCKEFDFDKSVATAVKDEIGESYEASESLCQGHTCKEFDFDKNVATAVKDEIGESYEALETLCQGHTCKQQRTKRWLTTWELAVN